MTVVVNIKTDEYDVRIDRSTRWGNPYPIGHLSRRQVISKYREYLEQEIREGRVTREDLLSLKGLRLGCWCKPLSCHGDVLREFIEQASKDYKDNSLSF